MANGELPITHLIAGTNEHVVTVSIDPEELPSGAYRSKVGMNGNLTDMQEEELLIHATQEVIDTIPPPHNLCTISYTRTAQIWHQGGPATVRALDIYCAGNQPRKCPEDCKFVLDAAEAVGSIVARQTTHLEM